MGSPEFHVRRGSVVVSISRGTTARAGSNVDFGQGSSRRGGMAADEIQFVREHRSRARPTGWQTLSEMTGRPAEELRALCGDLPPLAMPDGSPLLPNARADRVLALLGAKRAVEDVAGRALDAAAGKALARRRARENKRFDKLAAKASDSLIDGARAAEETALEREAKRLARMRRSRDRRLNRNKAAARARRAANDAELAATEGVLIWLAGQGEGRPLREVCAGLATAGAACGWRDTITRLQRLRRDGLADFTRGGRGASVWLPTVAGYERAGLTPPPAVVAAMASPVLITGDYRRAQNTLQAKLLRDAKALPERRRILRMLLEAGGPLRAEQVGARLRISPQGAGQKLRALREAGVVFDAPSLRCAMVWGLTEAGEAEARLAGDAGGADRAGQGDAGQGSIAA